MESLGSRESKRVCAIAFVVGDVVTGVCLHILKDITVKYSYESRFVDFGEHFSLANEQTRRKDGIILNFRLSKKMNFEFI